MTEEQLEGFARNLRKPQGEVGTLVGQRMNSGNRFINEATIEAVKPSPGDRILEIGMGNGFFVQNIFSVSQDLHYTGVDFSDIMIDEAKRINNVFIEQGKADFFLNDADSLPFKSASFNKIFTVNTLYFWNDTTKTLAEFRRVLETDGVLIVAIRPKSNMINLPFVKYGFTMYDREEVESLLKLNGFTVINSVERVEPAQEINGVTMQMETLIVKAKVT